MRGFLMGRSKSIAPVHRPPTDNYALDADTKLPHADPDDDADVKLPNVVEDIKHMALALAEEQRTHSNPSHPVQQEAQQEAQPEPATGTQENVSKATQLEAEGTQSGPSSQTADAHEFPPGSRVTQEQYQRSDVRKKYDDAAAVVAAEADAPLCIYPSEKPYICYCEIKKCMRTFATWEESLASTLEHSPDLNGASVNIAAGFWTNDSPQSIVFNVVTQAEGPVEDTQSCSNFWPRNTPFKQMPSCEAYKAAVKQSGGKEKVKQLLTSAFTWAGKQPRGTVHVFSEYDDSWKEGAKVVRKYICPEPSCDKTSTEPKQMLLHIRTHPSLAQQQVLFYLIEMDKTTGEPDYKQSTSRIGNSSSSASHSGDKRTDDSQAGGRGLREKKQRKNRDDQHNGNDRNKKPDMELVKEAMDILREANAKELKAAEQVYEMKLELSNSKVQQRQPDDDRLFGFLAEQNQLNREAQEKQMKMFVESQTQMIQLFSNTPNVSTAGSTETAHDPFKSDKQAAGRS